jgi:hypothetical protein
MSSKKLEIHTLPIQDTINHTTSSRCKCKPVTEIVNTHLLVTHQQIGTGPKKNWTIKMVDKRPG